MKKLIISLALTAFATAAMAQTPRDARQEARQERIEQITQQMQAALATQNFMFIPSQMNLAFRGPIQLNTLSYSPFLDVLPTYLSVNLPYSLQNTPPTSRVFDLYMPSVPYTYSVKQGTGSNTYYVSIRLTSVSNSNVMFMPLETKSMNMSIHMNIDVVSGYTIMTIIPDFAAPITYNGTATAN
ncbi:MAG: hypothetical protein RR551_00820 [Mucinivorans sp.]